MACVAQRLGDSRGSALTHGRCIQSSHSHQLTGGTSTGGVNEAVCLPGTRGAKPGAAGGVSWGAHWPREAAASTRTRWRTQCTERAGGMRGGVLGAATPNPSWTAAAVLPCRVLARVGPLAAQAGRIESAKSHTHHQQPSTPPPGTSVRRHRRRRAAAATAWARPKAGTERHAKVASGPSGFSVHVVLGCDRYPKKQATTEGYR